MSSLFKVPTFLLTSIALFLGLSGLTQAQSRLAVSPGVTVETLDKIDQIEDEALKEMLHTAVWPGYGERYLDLNQADEELSDFQKKYKAYPLTWEEQVDNVKFVLEQAEDLATLTPEKLEYKDLAFGEAVIPVPDKRVVAIWNTDFLTDQETRLQAERDAAIAALGENPDGNHLQAIEDRYATQIATLYQVEQRFKESKVDFLDLENKRKYERIDEETYQAETRALVTEFENFARLGSDVELFDETTLRNVSGRIYQDSDIKTDESVESFDDSVTQNLKFWHWFFAFILTALGGWFVYKALQRIKKNHQ